jgi:hypothetical protein
MMAAQAQAQPQASNFAPQGVAFGAQGLPFINPLLAQVKHYLSVFVVRESYYRESLRALT